MSVQLRCGGLRIMRGVYVGQHERTGDELFLIEDGVLYGCALGRLLEEDRHRTVFQPQ